MRRRNTHGGDPDSVACMLGLHETPEVQLDFSVNINPLGPPPSVTMALAAALSTMQRYPQHHAEKAASALAAAHDVASESVLVGNGATEIFGWILQSLKPSSAGWLSPTYCGYSEACRASGVKGRSLGVTSSATGFGIDFEALKSSKADLIFLASPNNPTGTTLRRQDVLDLATTLERTWIVVDESFLDFLPDAAARTLIYRDMPHNLIVVKSLTKFFAIPGLRLGMACASAETAERIRASSLPWSVNGIAQMAGGQLYTDQSYLESSRREVIDLRARLESGLKEIPGITVFPSESNFLLVRLPEAWPAKRLQAAMLPQGILIRTCEDFEGLDKWYCRLAVRPEHETALFLEAFSELINGNKSCAAKKTPAIMVVGTTSNAGKSAVAAGLCRYLARRGVAVSPFKAQNMALNSFVTQEGGEMGRAQVVQADAAGIPPHTDMNPVLLKPLGDDGSQVIVNGLAIGNFKAREYYAMKSQMRQAAHDAYDRLAARSELIVMEGAGSPAEINLLAEDFVNMDMAAYADAMTILVADIDRGGVFASIFGTIALVPPRHRHLIKGVVINKFRGDVSLLDSGIRDIEAMTGVPVLGVLPYLKDLSLEDEDSLGLENRPGETEPLVDIVVVRLPRISNFTDFLPLERMRGVKVRYLPHPAQLGQPDLIIIPGTKNTRGDLKYLKEQDWFAPLRKAPGRGIPVIGICGGYQILGDTVDDPEGVEGKPGLESGLGMLPITTVLKAEKELSQITGHTTESMPFCPAGTPFSGYEIHAGETSSHDPSPHPLITEHRGTDALRETSAAVSSDQQVFGCYIHGLFDDRELRGALITHLCERKGVILPEQEQEEDPGNDAFERLADGLEQHLDLGKVFGVLDLLSEIEIPRLRSE
ncbi:MAG: cobyric acid synthase [Kiritimatiellia bacterium]|nr:cobyric acid synthase [Kiritimatiellia bacterium]